ncbi:MAG: hypothetical protein QXO47_03420 [Thermoproteota archaeon]
MTATIWEWGDKFEDVKTNIEKYLNKKWKETIRECLVEIRARERDEGISYHIVTYVGDPKSVGGLVESLFYAALDEGDTKVDSITIRLSDRILSTNLKCPNTIEEVEKMIKECEDALTNKFMEDPKVKQVAYGKKVKVIPQIDILCELKSGIANKIIIEAIHEDFLLIKNLLHSLSNRIIGMNLAERILGYKLVGDVEDFRIGYIDVWKDEVTVWLV